MIFENGCSSFKDFHHTSPRKQCRVSAS